MHKLIAPSMLSADFSHLVKDIDMVNNSMADWFHIDVMDGVFVPNISFGFPILKRIKEFAKKPLDVHLMIVNPDRYIKQFKEHGADIITIHYEACTHLHRSIYAIKDLGLKAGVALNPHTNVEVLENVIHDIDMVLIMSVNPGFGAQKFIDNTYNKIRKFKDLLEQKKTEVLIEVDGGVSEQNAAGLFNAGANILVAGNSVFSSENPEDVIRSIKSVQ